ncbi:MAG: hypothetical protein LBL50_03655 [Candidatus Margulisbacteria bacterium]|jgi:primosomal protein N'|nr:hypothetical protein [Candidatus Margulisiibacteriota bacterium]
MTKFAEIYINKKIYTYSVTEETKVGCAVEATLRGKPYTGYVLRFVEQPEFKTLPIQRISSPPNFDENLVKLIYWIAEYYKCFPETAVKLILPRS